MTVSYSVKLVWTRWKMFFQAWYGKGNRREGSTNNTQFERSPSSIEELCRQTTQTLVLSSWRLCLPESLTNEGCISFCGKGEACTAVHWLVSYYWKIWTSGVPTPTIRNIVCCAQCVPRISVEEVSSGSRSNCWSDRCCLKTRLDIFRTSYSSLGSKGQDYPTENSQVL
jgi:hypothetical protein